MLQLAAELIERHTQGASEELRLHAPDLARRLNAGQAVLLRAGWGQTPYLRRVFHPIAIDADTWTVRLPPSGDWGHAWLRAAPLGTHLDCLGPIGIGYVLPAGIRSLLCVGEGEAAWSLLPVVCLAAAQGISVTFALEAGTARQAIPATRLPSSVEYHVATVDGSLGSRGKLAGVMGALLGWADGVLAAGSLDFYAGLSEEVKRARFRLVPGFAQVLYPANILCGTGACQACAADVAGGRRRMCLRGPVLDLAELLA